MSQAETMPARATPEPLPENITSVQPGGGFCYQVELAWGQWRRAWLKTFRRGYVRRMAAKRTGDEHGAPHEILDPRDLKYCRNLCTADWTAADDPFQYRERLGLARWGLAETLLMSTPLLMLCIALGLKFSVYAAIVPGLLLIWVISFFRDPRRAIPAAAGLIVSPADGKIAEVSRVEFDEFIAGPAIKIGIFLSIFNVHLNRAPARSRVIRLRYWPGKFLNALNPTSVLLNESMWIGLEEEAAPHRKIVVRQIAGLFARRIVCALRSGEVVERGAKIGMIKLGSRTEILIPDQPGVQVMVSVGQNVSAGSTVFAQYPDEPLARSLS